MKVAALLAVLSTVLAIVVGKQLIWKPEAEIAVSSPSASRGATAGTTLPKIGYPPKRAYARINDDNLFGPKRRPVGDIRDPGPAPRSPRTTGQPSFELKGIVITPTGRYALLKLPRQSDYRKAITGETVEGWVIDSIKSDSVLVKKQGTSIVVTLKTPKSSGRTDVPRVQPRRRLPTRRP